MKKAELVFIPSPITGHLVSMVELAKDIVNHNRQISITILIMKSPFDAKASAYAESLTHFTVLDRIRFVTLPHDRSDVVEGNITDFFVLFVESQKRHVKEVVTQLTDSNSFLDSTHIVGFVIDSFCTTMIDVANEFSIPTYVFFTSSAAFLGLMFHLQSLQDDHNIDVTEFKDSGTELVVPSSIIPIPAKVLPAMVLYKYWVRAFLNYPRRFRETKGILVNTFYELEPHAVDALSDLGVPPVYAVGPVLNVKGSSGQDEESSGVQEIMKWLNIQPDSSVVFLCFGTMGGFREAQVREIAHALEHSEHRFLWSLRRIQPRGQIELPSEYTDFDQVLPQGFLDRTTAIGRVIGYAPQVSILAHKAIGGFVSHCGWNSILESLYYGVPIATWPMYAEQQFNAFEMVKELGLGVEISLDYRKDALNDDEVLVTADEIEKGIGRLMINDGELRSKLKEVSQRSKNALMDGGSSYSSLERLIKNILLNNVEVTVSK